ncbi:MAG: Calx-beta domain-containing protein, partial [Planctomycetota bacterium]
IVGELPLVQFEGPSMVLAEDSGDTHVNVTLSHPCGRRVIVGYALVAGSATSGQDFRVPAGRLVFEPGQSSRSITIDLIDDNDAENSINETAFVQLDAAKNCELGDDSTLRIEIVDNEPWIEFDGCMWISGQSKHTIVKGRKVLSINKKGQLEWVSDYGDILYAKLPPKSTNKVGDVARYGWQYKGDGQCRGSYVENICERYGSGDLRVAMLDLGDKSMSLDKQYTRNDKIFCGSRGYQARLSPHVPTDQRADKWATRVTPNGDNCHSPVDWGGCWGFETYYNGHGVPVGEFTPMIITVERTTEDTIEFSVDMNNEKHIMVDKNKYLLSQDKDKMREHFGMGAYGTGAYGTGYGPGVYEVEIDEDYQPEKIDVMAIYFANQRPFDLITFAPLK